MSVGRPRRRRAALTGRQKAAVFLDHDRRRSAPPRSSSSSAEREIEALSAEMAALWRVKAETADEVVSRSSPSASTRRPSSRCGGPEFAREVLEHLLGPDARRGDPRPDHRRGRAAPVRLPAPHAAGADRARSWPTRRRRPSRSSSPRCTRRWAPACSAALPPELQADVAMRIAHDGGHEPGGRRGRRARAAPEALQRPDPGVRAGRRRRLARRAAQPRRPLHGAHGARGDRRGSTASWPTRSARSCSPSTTSSCSATATSSCCCARSTRRTSRWRCAASARRSRTPSSATCPRAAPRCSTRTWTLASRSGAPSSRRPRAGSSRRSAASRRPAPSRSAAAARTASSEDDFI